MEDRHERVAEMPARRPRWSKGKLVGAKPPLRRSHVWSIRTKLQIEDRKRHLALINLAIDSKLRGCDVVAVRVDDVAPSGYAMDRATIRQKETGRAVRFELSDQTRMAIDEYLRLTGRRPGQFLFAGRGDGSRSLTTRQYARLVQGVGGKHRSRSGQVRHSAQMEPRAPMSLQPILNNLALATLTSFVATLGAAQLAGFGVALRLQYLLYPLAFSLGAGVLAMVGTNIGAGHFARAERIAWTAAALAAGVTGCVGLFSIVWPGAWTGLFTELPEVHALAAGYLAIIGLAFPFLGLGLTLASAFQAAGRPLWPLFGITSSALVVVGGGWIAVHLTGTSLSHLAVVAALSLLTYGAGLAVAFRAGAWQSRRVSAEPPAIA